LENELKHHWPLPDKFEVEADLKNYPSLILANDGADKILHNIDDIDKTIADPYIGRK